MTYRDVDKISELIVNISMILTAHQPAYIPWAGLIHKIYLSDVFVFDDVQYVPKDFMNRNFIFRWKSTMVNGASNYKVTEKENP